MRASPTLFSHRRERLALTDRRIGAIVLVHGRVPKWPKGTDCKSVIRGFKSHRDLSSTPRLRRGVVVRPRRDWARFARGVQIPPRPLAKAPLARGFVIGPARAAPALDHTQAALRGAQGCLREVGRVESGEWRVGLLGSRSRGGIGGCTRSESEQPCTEAGLLDQVIEQSVFVLLAEQRRLRRSHGVRRARGCRRRSGCARRSRGLRVARRRGRARR